MRRLWSLFRGRPPRRARDYRPGVGLLEGREMLATAVSGLTVTPELLNPPNNGFVQVTVKGYILESNVKFTPNASYQVVDDYRRIQPLGKVTITHLTPTVYTFSFPLVLQAKRVNEYPAGRHYYILVKSADPDNANGVYAAVLVPHDKLPPGVTTIYGPVQKLKAMPPKKYR